MTDQIVVRPGTEIELGKLYDEAKILAESSRATATRKAYASDWSDFRSWASKRGLTSLPAEPPTIVLYLTDRASSLSVPTLRRRLTSIAIAHRLAGWESNHRHAAVKEVMAGIARVRSASPRQKKPLMTKDIREIIRVLPEGAQGARDAALLLVGLAGGFRRSELASMKIEDVQFVDDGAIVTVRKSKTDQEGIGALVGIPFGSNKETCPVRTLKRWIEVGNITSGHLFRRISRSHVGRVLDQGLSGKGIYLIVRRCADRAGYDAHEFGAHSLRSGMATQAAISGASLPSLMAQGRWTSVNTVVSRYVRPATLFTDNAAGKLGL